MEEAERLNGSSSSGIRYGPEMGILIVGGGIAGLTLCSLLEQRSFSPTIVERAHKYGNVGYVIVLWPSESRILKGLGPEPFEIYRKILFNRQRTTVADPELYYENILKQADLQILGRYSE